MIISCFTLNCLLIRLFRPLVIFGFLHTLIEQGPYLDRLAVSTLIDGLKTISLLNKKLKELIILPQFTVQLNLTIQQKTSIWSPTTQQKNSMFQKRSQ